MGTLLGLVTLAGSGCAQPPYEPGYRYFPQPATVDVLRRDGNHQTPLTVLVSVLGVHRADPKNDIPYSVVVRMRFENVGQSHVIFDPRSLELVTGTLRPFEPPIVRPSQTLDLTPGQRQEVTAYFPFPPHVKAENMNMRNLRLRWEVKIDGVTVPQTSIFERVPGGGYEEDTDLYY